MYRSALFKAQHRYALICCDRFYILSAKHGLLHPDTIIEPYEQRLPAGPARLAWGRRVAQQLDAAEPDLDVGLVVLAGSAYADAFDPEDRDWPWEEPLRGLGIGERIAWLNRAVREAPSV
jgi:hypothetical protein